MRMHCCIDKLKNRKNRLKTSCLLSASTELTPHISNDKMMDSNDFRQEPQAFFMSACAVEVTAQVCLRSVYCEVHY